MTAPPPGPGYGSLVLITSYDDSLIGSTGAAISHGCVRLHDVDLARLSVSPPGTPIDIVS